MKKDIVQAYNFIKIDIERELQLARLSQNTEYSNAVKPFNQNLGGGNFLCATALFSYIEFLGRTKYNKQKKQKGKFVDFASANFNSAFDDLGAYYKSFRVSHNVYDIFRCGLVHEYYVKGNAEIAMFGDRGLYGLGSQNGKYYVIIENLFLDFILMFDDYLTNEK